MDIDAVKAKLTSYSNERLEDGSPRFLFRGQCKEWRTPEPPYSPTVTPSIARLSTRHAQIQALDVCRHAKLLGFGLFGYSIKTIEEAIGLLQHYKWPTPALDFTDDPEVALWFAAEGYVRGDVAVMRVIDTTALPCTCKLSELWFTPVPLAEGGLNTRFLHQSGWILLPEYWVSTSSIDFDLCASPTVSAVIAQFYFEVPDTYAPRLPNLMEIQDDPLPNRVQDVVRVYLNHLEQQGIDVAAVLTSRADQIAGNRSAPIGLTTDALGGEIWALPRWHALAVATQIVEMTDQALGSPFANKPCDFVRIALTYARDACGEAAGAPDGHLFDEVKQVQAAPRSGLEARVELLLRAASNLISTAQVYEWNTAAGAGLAATVTHCLEAVGSAERGGSIQMTEVEAIKTQMLSAFRDMHSRAQSVHWRTDSVKFELASR